jgi:ribosomal protein L37AE/L43A
MKLVELAGLRSQRFGYNMKKTEEEEKIKCPMCGRKKAVIKLEDHLYLCSHCDMQFDDRED